MDKQGIKHRDRSVDPSMWVDQYGDFLYRYALSRLRDAEASEEVVQDCFVAGLRAVDQYAGKGDQRCCPPRHSALFCASSRHLKSAAARTGMESIRIRRAREQNPARSRRSTPNQISHAFAAEKLQDSVGSEMPKSRQLVVA